MFTEIAVVETTEQLEKSIYLLKVNAPQIAADCKPGQFCNLKVNNLTTPLLRRPFSICDVEDDSLFFMFEVCGEGTNILKDLQPGSQINVLGPLGNGFNTDGDYQTAVFVAGGIGVAPFPFLTSEISEEIEIFTFLGGRNKEHIISYELENVFISTDDGSMGLKGNVIELLKKNMHLFEDKKIRIFSCGPNAMLKALQAFALENKLDCQLSLEGAMACGFGICQGCAVESAKEPEKYDLVCKDGPVFNAGDIKL